jgi:hypothetical protein
MTKVVDDANEGEDLISRVRSLEPSGLLCLASHVFDVAGLYSPMPIESCSCRYRITWGLPCRLSSGLGAYIGDHKRYDSDKNKILLALDNIDQQYRIH